MLKWSIPSNKLNNMEAIKVLIILTIAGIAFVLTVTGCGPSAEEREKMRKNCGEPVRSNELSKESEYRYNNYEIYTLEGCEYILVNRGDRQWGSHKGNCKNPIHYPTLNEMK